MQTGAKNVTQFFVPVGERGCASKAPYKNNPIFIMSIFIRCVLLGPHSFLQGQTKVSKALVPQSLPPISPHQYQSPSPLVLRFPTITPPGLKALNFH